LSRPLTRKRQAQRWAYRARSHGQVG
jgi:hypothetical protein